MSTRQDILSALEAHRGTPLSGAALAKELGISRTAVWKAINRLRSEGFMIEAGTNKGYMLLEGRDVLTAEAVTAHLHHKVPVYVYDVVDSTNKVAASMAMDRAPHGTTVIADQQTAGRGRRGRRSASGASAHTCRISGTGPRGCWSEGSSCARIWNR